MTLGDGVGVWLLMLWLAVHVGPWWYAPIIVVVVLAGNIAEQVYNRRPR